MINAASKAAKRLYYESLHHFFLVWRTIPSETKRKETRSASIKNDMVLIKLTSPEIVSEGAFLEKTVKQLRSDITRLAVREIRKVLIASTYGKKWADWFSVQASYEATKAIITKDASIARTITPNLIVARGLGCLHGVLPMFPDRVYAKWGKTTGIPMGGTPSLTLLLLRR